MSVNNGKPPILIVGGPTASGKSALALDLALSLGGTVINADSMQVYHELRILSARPTPEDEARATHRLYGVLAASERCSAGRWLDMARAEVAQVQANGLLPILVGGTGLYLHALLHGLASVPPIAPELRARAKALHSEIGAAEFYRLLVERDPEYAERLHPSNKQRVLRAYEVLEATGKSLAVWQRSQPKGKRYSGHITAVVLEPPRSALYAACDDRAEIIAMSGGIEEAAALVALNLDPSLPAMKALGVREFSAHLKGDRTLPEAINMLRQATRRYAKRQSTWFRHQMPEATAIAALYSKQQADQIRQTAADLLQTSAQAD